MGDTSDNYPGVTKVGEKTALKLLNQYGSMENLYANVDDMKKSKLKENLISDKDNAFLSKQLATIDRDAPLTVDLADVTYAGPDLDKLRDFYTKMNMNSLLKKSVVVSLNLFRRFIFPCWMSNRFLHSPN